MVRTASPAPVLFDPVPFLRSSTCACDAQFFEARIVVITAVVNEEFVFLGNGRQESIQMCSHHLAALCVKGILKGVGRQCIHEIGNVELVLIAVLLAQRPEELPVAAFGWNISPELDGC